MKNLRECELVGIEELRGCLGGVCRRTVERLIAKGEFAVVRVGRRVLVEASSVVAYLKRNRREVRS